MTRPTRLVVCINERLGTGQRSCVGSGSPELIRSIRQMIEAEGLEIPIIERECLGKCEEGPVMRIAPGGEFFTEIDDDSLPRILDALKSFVARQR